MGFVFVFDAFELDTNKAQLTCGGVLLKTDAQLLRLLEAFVRNPGRMMLKDELVALVWEGRVVSDNALTVAMARLRKVLARVPSGRDLLITVHGQGYRLACDVAKRSPEKVGRFTSTTERTALPLVGREQIIAHLSDALSSARAGRGRFVALTGPKGIGKTRLADEVATEASLAGNLVAWGCWSEFGGPPPLWPIAELVREVLRMLPARLRARPEVEALLPVLAPLLPELSGYQTLDAAGWPRAESARLQVHERALYDAIVRLFRVAAEHAPLVLVLDDLHCADDASSELLAMVSRLVGHPSCLRLALSPLMEDEVTAYVSAALGTATAGLCRTVFGLSAGNPFYMAELTRRLRLNPGADVDVLVPGLSQELLHQQARDLEDAVQDVLTWAAVVGPRFGLRILEAATGRASADLVKDLDKAIACDVVTPARGSATEFVFVHELQRRRYYGALAPAERRARHLALLQVLADQARGFAALPSDLAFHAHAALPDGNPRKAVRYCREAADAAVRARAFTSAARHLRQALEALELSEGACPRLRFHLMFRLAVIMRGQSTRDFVPLVERILCEARRQADPSALARAALLLDPLPGFPRLAVVRRALPDALARMPPDARTLRAALLARLTHHAPLAYDAVTSHAQLDQALSLAQQSPESGDRFSARFAELYLYGGPAHEERARTALAAIQRLSVEHRVGPLPPLLLDIHRAMVAFQRGDMLALKRSLDRCRHACRSIDTELTWFVERFAAVARIVGGDPSGGRSALRTLHAQLTREGPFSGTELFVAYDQCVLLSGPDTTAHQVLAPQSDDPPNIWALKVRALSAAGVTEEARSALALVPARRLSQLPCSREYLGTIGALARAALELDAADYLSEAYTLLSVFPDYFAVNVSFYCEGPVPLLLGLIAERLGKAQDARTHLELAVIHGSRAGMPAHAAEARRALARLPKENSH